jgi:hypothetical protein
MQLSPETHRNLNDIYIFNQQLNSTTTTTAPTIGTAGEPEAHVSGSPPSTTSNPHHAHLLLIEPDPNSFCSDYSEMGEPIREHLANVQIIVRADLDLGNTAAPAPASPSHHQQQDGSLQRAADESDEEYARRVRKTNYLSLAQEFAALKRINADALPFDLHQHHQPPQLPQSAMADRLGDPEDEDDDDDDDEESSIDGTGGRRSLTEEMSLGSVECQRSVSPPSPSDQRTLCDIVNNTVPDVIPDPHRNLHTSSGTESDIIRPSHNPHSCTSSTVGGGSQLPSDVLDGGGQSVVMDSSSATKGLTSSAAANQDVKMAAASASVVATATARRKAADDATAMCMEEFDVYTIESALQNVEWQKLMEMSSSASSASRSTVADGNDRKRWSRCGDRDEIRRRLAMSADDDYCAAGAGFNSSTASLLRKSQPAFHATRLLHSTTSLQVCFLNDDAANFDGELTATSSGTPSVTSCAKPDIIPKSISEASSLSAVHCKAGSASQSLVHEDFFTKQARLQAEAKLALAQVRPMAHMQLQLEKEQRKKSPLSEMVVSIPGFVDGKLRQLNRQLLQRMNIAQLQVVVNDLHTQIEALNADLMQQLVDRDDLHMAQDSMLVDIDDLTRRAQEFAAKVNKQCTAAADCGHHK